MKALVDEINEKLSGILTGLENRKHEIDDSLAVVQEKIDKKIEEAKRYKVDVDAAKSEIRRLEDEILSLESDLNDLTNRFSGKDLQAIVETGNKEINAQISNRRNEIAKQRDKIAEYTEKARTIKDLLINLKRDKENKKAKYLEIDNIYNYYSVELHRIMDHASENPNNLIPIYIEKKEEKDEFTNEPIIEDDSIFDAIESIKEEDAGEKHLEKDLGVDLAEEDINQNVFDSESTENANNAGNYLFTAFGNVEDSTDDEKQELKENDAEESNESENNGNDGALDYSLNDYNLFSEDETNNEPIHEEDLYKSESGDITSLFNQDSNDSFDSFDFKSLNDSIDREYENIFGNSEDIKLTDEDDIFNFKSSKDNIFDNSNEVKEEDNGLVIPDDSVNFFGNTEPVENFLNSNISENNNEDDNDSSNEEVSKFFKSNNLDFTKFSNDEQEKLKNNFNLINYTKTLDILRKNNIRLEYLYGAADIFKMIHSELENIINKLLLAGQSTLNISYVLNALPLINSFDLQDVIDSYGPAIKDANITDLIIKAKHLKELGGGNN